MSEEHHKTISVKAFMRFFESFLNVTQKSLCPSNHARTPMTQLSRM